MFTLMLFMQEALPAPFRTNIGLIIWTWIVFIGLFLLLRKYAFPPIVRLTEERERKTYAKALAKEESFLTSNKVVELRAADLLRIASRYGRAATELLCRHLQDAEPIIRESAAGALSRDGGPSCRPPLRAALAEESNDDAARAMIHTLGVKSDPEAVAVIAKRLANEELEQAAVQGLGRIATDEAIAALRRHRDNASPAARALIDSLLKERGKKRGRKR